MKDILSAERQVFQNHEIVPVTAPRYKELTVEKILEMVRQVPAVLRYLPSDCDSKIPRSFLFNVSGLNLFVTISKLWEKVVNTVVPSFFAKVIPDAEAKRQTPKKDDELIVVDPKMVQLIKAFKATRHGTKKGRLHLLKKSSRKRRRAEFEQQHDLSTSILEASKKNTETDIFKRLSLE